MKKTIERQLGNEQALMLVLAIILSVAALWAVGCGGGGYSSSSAAPTAPSTSAGSTPAPSTPSGVTVSIVSSSGSAAFSPNPVQAAQGASIVWRNNTNATHVLMMNDGTAIGTVAPGASVTIPLSGAGGSYHCVTHPSMVGSINGASAPEPPSGAGSDY